MLCKIVYGSAGGGEGGQGCGGATVHVPIASGTAGISESLLVFDLSNTPPEDCRVLGKGVKSNTFKERKRSKHESFSHFIPIHFLCISPLIHPTSPRFPFLVFVN